MFCNKCGKEISEGSTFCPHCGSPLLPGENQQKTAASEQIINTEAVNKKLQDFSNKARNISQNFNGSETINNKVYITYIIALLECIFPFMPWVKVPIYNAIGNFFGASSDISSYSLFSYTGTIQDQTTFTSIMILVFCLGTIIGIICNILYIVKGWKNTCVYHGLGRTASFLMIIVSLAFLIVLGFTTWILKLIKITVIPLLLLIASVLNFRLIKTL